MMQRLLLSLAAISTSFTVVTVESLELGRDFWIGDPNNSDVSRELKGSSCPLATPVLEEEDFTGIFDLLTTTAVTCSKVELKRIGKVLQKEVPKLLLHGDGQITEDDIVLLDSDLDVCLRNKELERSSGGPRKLSVGSDNGHHHPEKDRRNLQIGFRVHLYRSIGRCSFCRKDNLDSNSSFRQRRELNDDPFQDPVIQYFSRVLQEVEDILDERMTKEILRRYAKGQLPCLDNTGVRVKATLAPRVEALFDDCAPVKCCGSFLDPQAGCDDSHDATQFCHSDKDICKDECNGMWLNPFNPPQCVAWYKVCDINDDQCCNGSLCMLDGSDAVCMPEDDLLRKK